VTAPLWSGEAVLASTAGAAHGDLPVAVGGVSIDTRTLAAGDAFFAIRGDRLDGHAFVRDAFGRGAALAVVEADRVGELSGAGPLIAVPDVLEALAALGRAARARASARIVAVTGSVGKTSTKEALRQALGASGATHGSAASHNNHWGVPLTLSRLPADARFAVFEIGMNHAGEISPLTRLVRPHVAVVTTVEPVHLEHFPSVEAIADAKAEIFEGLEPGGAAVLNRDNPHFARLAAAAQARGARVVGFGFDPAAEVRADGVVATADGSAVSATVLGRKIAFKVGAPGRHLVQNSLAVLAAAELLGADLARAALALAEFTPPPGRGEQHRLATPSGPALLIDESYNANPASMRAALALLGGSRVEPRGRRIAVLGDMLELGPTAEDLHRSLSGEVEEARVDLVFAAGPLMRALFEALPGYRRGQWAPSAAELRPALLETVRGGDVIMVKGSNGSRMGPLAAALRSEFGPPNGVAASGE
jgi:UDP-N-acetylmuramoyl-tripeptide--D-alanyl-D-alanine ligase